MKSKNVSKKILDEIRQAFSKRRRQFGRKPYGGYPEPFRKLAVAAASKGISFNLVAEAAGVNEASVRSWSKVMNVAAESARELKLVDAPADRHVRDAESTGAARIFFQSGVQLEVPVCALTVEFFKTLSEVGQ